MNGRQCLPALLIIITPLHTLFLFILYLCITLGRCPDGLLHRPVLQHRVQEVAVALCAQVSPLSVFTDGRTTDSVREIAERLTKRKPLASPSSSDASSDEEEPQA